MIVRRLATAAALCVLATPMALAQTAAPAAPAPGGAGTQPPSAKTDASWPRVLPDKNAAPPPAAPAEWSRQDIELAQARCAALLKGLDFVAVPATPIREGPGCGTPAPMKLVSIGKNPEVALSPPPTVTCDMIAAMHKWMERDLQPLARKHLGAPVIRIETMSSYSCRNAYGRTNSRLSEHGRANAIDIGAFITARGQTAMVVADWGLTAREIAAAAKAQAQKAQAAAPAPNGAAPQPQQRTAGPPQPTRQQAAPATLRAGVTFSMPGVSVQLPGTGFGHAPELGLSQPSRLGGPKPQDTPVAANRSDGKMDFLRAAHRTACKVFGTVLGPEANNAHKNHFHVDMAERRGVTICE